MKSICPFSIAMIMNSEMRHGDQRVWGIDINLDPVGALFNNTCNNWAGSSRVL